jgi:aminoglycoside phosphotransferase (APT) family kinase protein
MSASEKVSIAKSQLLERAELLARGFTSDIYAWGKGRVLKLFFAGLPREKAEREFRVTRAVHAAGLPAPAAFEVVDIDGRPGIVLERVEGISLFRQVQARPWTLFRAVRMLADLQAEIHRCEAPLELPSQREWIAGRIDAATELSAAEKESARRRLAELPEGTAVCHGDFHPENVFITPRGFIVIDWETATRGHPLGDIACTSRLFDRAVLPDSAPRFTHWLLACFRTQLHRTYLARSLALHGGTNERLQEWKRLLATVATSGRIAHQSTTEPSPSL